LESSTGCASNNKNFNILVLVLCGGSFHAALVAFSGDKINCQENIQQKTLYTKAIFDINFMREDYTTIFK
jgi:hypothetical protein